MYILHIKNFQKVIKNEPWISYLIPMDEPDWTTSSSSQSNIDIPEPNNDIPENVKCRTSANS